MADITAHKHELADVAAVQGALGRLDCRVVTVVEPRLQLDSMCARRGHDLQCLFNIARQWFFNDDMLLVLGCRDGNLRMPAGRRCHIDNIHIAARNHSLPIACSQTAMLAGDSICPRSVNITRDNQSHVRRFRYGIGAYCANLAATD